MQTQYQDLNMHVPEHVREQFYNLYNKLNEKSSARISQWQTLEYLLNFYHKYNGIPDDAIEIILPMFCFSETHKTPVRSICFWGKIEFESNWYSVELTPLYISELQKDFNFWITNKYSHHMWHKLDVYYAYEKEKYIVQEWIRVNKDLYRFDVDCGEYHYEKSICVLEVKRCKFIESFDDFNKHFGKYSSAVELVNVSNFIPNDIGTDYQLMDELF